MMDQRSQHEENENRILDHDPNPVQIPPHMEDRIVARLVDQELITPSSSVFWATWFRVAASIVLLASSVYAGYLLGRNNMQPAVPVDASVKYLVLLYNPADFVESHTHAGEYASWMKSINDDVTSFSGEELTGFGWTFSKEKGALLTDPRPVASERGVLSGFFVLNTNSSEHALEIAGSCPHLKYNGVVELRPIERHN